LFCFVFKCFWDLSLLQIDNSRIVSSRVTVKISYNHIYPLLYIFIAILDWVIQRGWTNTLAHPTPHTLWLMLKECTHMMVRLISLTTDGPTSGWEFRAEWILESDSLREHWRLSQGFCATVWAELLLAQSLLPGRGPLVVKGHLLDPLSTKGNDASREYFKAIYWLVFNQTTGHQWLSQVIQKINHHSAKNKAWWRPCGKKELIPQCSLLSRKVNSWDKPGSNYRTNRNDRVKASLPRGWPPGSELVRRVQKGWGLETKE
jgi:hypothetical protein